MSHLLKLDNLCFARLSRDGHSYRISLPHCFVSSEEVCCLVGYLLSVIQEEGTPCQRATVGAGADRQAGRMSLKQPLTSSEDRGLEEDRYAYRLYQPLLFYTHSLLGECH